MSTLPGTQWSVHVSTWIIFTAITIIGVAAVAGVLFWLNVRRTARTIEFIAPALVELPELFTLIDISNERSHFLERHGPMLRKCVMLQRAETGRLDVSGHVGRPVASARWLLHADLLRAIVSAAEHWRNGSRPKGGRYVFAFETDVGEGFLKGGGNIIRTNRAVVIVRQDIVITAYPLLVPSAVTHDLEVLPD